MEGVHTTQMFEGFEISFASLSDLTWVRTSHQFGEFDGDTDLANPMKLHQ